MNFACDSSQWFHSIQPSCTCIAIDCNNIIINNISYAGNKLQGRCAEVDSWRRKATLQLSVFFQGDCVWVRTRQPEINVSKRRFRGEGVIAVDGSRAIMFDKMGPSNPAEHFSQRLPKCTVWGEAGWGKSTDLSLGGLLFLLPSYQVNGNKLLPIYSGISSWLWCGADRQRC